ncbi:GNAT family N-acetyltransferase [Clostridiaceae bacterium Marseille-Q4145]|nr:GNAT family N-acetyltransferase [Clostridiaceae bacterium Marseille-Q4145]RHU81659.1 N-acetyltransferase [Clostridiaceae bacterium OM08-6BH]
MKENESDWELDPEFEKRDALRKAGIPVEIARTDQLLIRETIDSDISELYRIGTDQAVRKYIAPMQPTLEEEIVYTKAYVRHMYAFYDFGLWTVLEKDAYGQERVIGRAGLFPSERLAGQIEMGYMIAPECQGNGYGKEAAETVLRYAFNVLDLEEVHLFVEKENKASVKLAETLLIKVPGGQKEKWQDLAHFWWENQNFS